MRTDMWIVITRVLWLDEWHTMLVANRASPLQIISDLYQGSDFAPPFIHLAAWTMRNIGLSSPWAIRLLPLACIILSLVLVYKTLRRRVDVFPGILGTMAVASHILPITHAFEIRFYASWLAAAAVFGWAAGLDPDRPRSRRREVVLAIASVVMVTSHWFGILTLGLLCGGAMLAFGRDWRAGVRRIAPAGVGLVVFAISLPLMFSQRGAIVTKSWLPDTTVKMVFEILGLFWFAVVPGIALVVILVAFLRSRLKHRVLELFAAAKRDPSMTAFVACALLPLLLAVVSIRQPALLTRYMITVLLAWAVVMGFGAQLMGRVLRIAVLLLLLGLFWMRTLHVALASRSFDFMVLQTTQALQEACKKNLPVVFTIRHIMYPTVLASPLREQCDTRYLALSKPTLELLYPGPFADTQKFFNLENEFCALHERLYGFPNVAPQAELDTTSAFLLLSLDESLPPNYKSIELLAPRVFPNHRFTRLARGLTLFERNKAQATQ